MCVQNWNAFTGNINQKNNRVAKLPIPRVELFIPYHFVLGILAQ